MTNRFWTDTNLELKNAVNSLAVHGYHNKIFNDIPKTNASRNNEGNDITLLCAKKSETFSGILQVTTMWLQFYAQLVRIFFVYKKRREFDTDEWLAFRKQDLRIEI